MYVKGKVRNIEENKPPFDVICNNCGSHNVRITAFEYYDLEIKCNVCGSYLSYGSYNPVLYNE